MKIAVQCHIYDSNIFWDDIEPRLKNIGQEFDLYISLTDNVDRTRDINRLKTKYPNCYVGLVPNVGEDLRGFFHCLNHIFDIKKDYDVVLKLHTKTRNDWRGQMLNCILNPNQTHIQKCIANKNFGMYGAKIRRYTLANDNKYSESSKKIYFFNDKSNMVELCKKIRCKTLCFDFFGGTMFWISFPLLKKYFGNNQIPEDYFFEQYAGHGLRAHAMERIFGCICYDNNLKIYDESSNPYSVAVLMATYNKHDLTVKAIESLKSNWKISNKFNIYILDNSDETPIKIDGVNILDNTNYKHTQNYKQISKNHCSSIDWALTQLSEDIVVLCDNDITFYNKINELSNAICSYDVIGEIGYDVVLPNRLFPYFCIFNLNKYKRDDIHYFDETRCMNNGKMDTGYSFLQDIKSKQWNIKEIKIKDYINHLKGASPRKKEYC